VTMSARIPPGGAGWGERLVGLREAGDMRRKAKSGRRPGGSAVVEVAIVLSFLLLVLFGIVDLGRAWWHNNVLHTACREGARLMAVSAAGDSLEVIGRIREVLGTAGIDPAPGDMKLIWPASGSSLPAVRVRIDHDFDLLAGPILGVVPGTIHMSAKCVMKYEASS